LISLRRRPPQSWIDFWNGETAIFANGRHRRLHYEELARELAVFIPDGGRVLDYGCGETLCADDLARRCESLLLFDAAPAIREKLRERFGNNAAIRVLDDDGLAAATCASLDLVVVNSVIQYLSRAEFLSLLDFCRARLREQGRLLLSDVPLQQGSPFADAVALLQFSWRGGFFFSAITSLARLYFSDYRRLRRERGFASYAEEELDAMLRQHGFCVSPLARNIGHNQNRRSLIAHVVHRSPE